MALSLLIEHIVRRREPNRICACGVAAPGRLERYIADIPAERYGRSDQAARVAG